jgi:hypothetical protein
MESMSMAKEGEGYVRECVLLARLADSVELRDSQIQLLRMMESSSEPRFQTKFPAPLKSTALSATPGIRLLFIAHQQMEIGTKPIPISVLTAVTNSALNAAFVFPSRRIETSDFPYRFEPVDRHFNIQVMDALCRF